MWWFISVNFNLPLSLSLRSRCVLVHHTILLSCLFFWYYLPSYWFYCNEWNSKTMMYHFRFYAVFVIWTKKTQKTKQKHYRCKAEVFFPQLYFFTLLQKVVFFNFSRTLTVMQNSGRASVPSEHKANSGYSFYVFIKGFQRWNYILLFSLWIVLLFLSILHFKNKTLILL